MKGNYHLLPNANTKSPQIAFSSLSEKHICPRITRTNLMCALAFVFVVALLLVLQCLGTSFANLCCPAAKTDTAQLNLETQTSNPVNNFRSVVTDQSHKMKFQYSRERNRLNSIENRDNQLDSINRVDNTVSAQRRRFPQVIIIGVRKGGTRALLEFLNLHPQIVAEKAEMHFFDDDEIYQNGLEWYRRKMPFTYEDQITIEKTPAYFTEEAVPERVYVMNRTCKFLIVMRDPTERAISDYTQIYFNKKDKGQSFESFEELAVDIYGTVKSYKAIRRSMYYKHMERWLNFFPLKQFHIVDGAKLVTDPVPELTKVEEFMGLEHKLTKDRFYYNSTRGFYCMKLEHKEKCLAKSKGRTHPVVDLKVIKILHSFFKPLNQKFYSIVQRDFGWPTE